MTSEGYCVAVSVIKLPSLGTPPYDLEITATPTSPPRLSVQLCLAQFGHPSLWYYSLVLRLDQIVHSYLTIKGSGKADCYFWILSKSPRLGGCPARGSQEWSACNRGDSAHSSIISWLHQLLFTIFSGQQGISYIKLYSTEAQHKNLGMARQSEGSLTSSHFIKTPCSQGSLDIWHIIKFLDGFSSANKIGDPGN